MVGIVLILMARAHHLATQPTLGPTNGPAGSYRTHTDIGPFIRCGNQGRVVSVTPDTPQNRSEAEQLCQAAATNGR